LNNVFHLIKAEGGAKDAKKGREPKNQVHQEAILVETIRKELAQQKLFTNYSVNPFKKCNSYPPLQFYISLFILAEALTPKPNVYPDENADEDCKKTCCLSIRCRF
jgi:hypothetical protein